MDTHPEELQGAWRKGWALDRHTTSSDFLGYDEQGHPQFKTNRSPLGEALYQLKYRGQQNSAEVAAAMKDFFGDKPNTLARIDAIVAMPPSAKRTIQPVVEVAKALAKGLNKPFLIDAVKKAKETPGLKDIHDIEERRELLDGAFKVDASKVKRKGILLVDDLYRSGATANAVTLALTAAGAERVYFLAATRTRSNT